MVFTTKCSIFSPPWKRSQNLVYPTLNFKTSGQIESKKINSFLRVTKTDIDTTEHSLIVHADINMVYTDRRFKWLK